MSWNTIKIDKADRLFSRYIRLRDKKCLRCQRPGEGAEGILKLQASHFHSRKKESVRYDEENVDSLCAYCHRFLHGGNRNIDYRELKLKQLGKEKREALDIRAEMYHKKDRQMALIIVQAMMDNLPIDKQNVI